MKIKFIKLRRLLFTTMAGLLGVNCGCDNSLPAAYGCPETQFDISGHVSDKEGNPIEGIVVDHYAWTNDTTDADGYYHIPEHDGSPDPEVFINFKDVDGDEHGAYRDTTVILTLDEDDYMGGTLTREVDVTLEPKTEKR